MKKLVLDFDETLVFSTKSEPESDGWEKMIIADTVFYTALRPGLKDFLTFCVKKFDVTIWTTGQQIYLDSLWEHFQLPSVTLWGREYCRPVVPVPTDGTEPYEKPLRQISEDLSQAVLVDNTPSMFSKYPLNGILSRTWRGEQTDTELFHLSWYLDWLSRQSSMQRDHQSWRLETLCLRSQ